MFFSGAPGILPNDAVRRPTVALFLVAAGSVGIDAATTLRRMEDVTLVRRSVFSPNRRRFASSKLLL